MTYLTSNILHPALRIVEQQFLALVNPYLIDIADGTNACRLLEQIAEVFRCDAHQSGERLQSNLFGIMLVNIVQDRLQSLILLSDGIAPLDRDALYNFRQ